MILIIPFKHGDLPVIIIHVHLVLFGQGISRSHVDSSFYFPFDVKILQEQHPAGLSLGQILGLFEISQILIVCDHSYRVFCSCKVVSPFFEGLNDSMEFSVIDVIMSLRGGEGCGVVSTGMEVPIGVLLYEYPSGSSEQGVGHDKKEFGSIRHLDHQGGQEGFFQFNKCVILFLPPLEGDSFLGQVMEGLCEGREAGDKLLIKIAEPNEGSDCFHQFGWFPLFYCLELCRVHVYFPILDHKSQILHLSLVKGTFGQL